MHDMSSISPTNGIRIHALQTGVVAIEEPQRNGQGREKRSLLRVCAARQRTEPLPILAWLIEHADPAAARTTLARVQQLVTDRPTVYLPTHDPTALERLTQRHVVAPSSMRLLA